MNTFLEKNGYKMSDFAPFLFVVPVFVLTWILFELIVAIAISIGTGAVAFVFLVYEPKSKRLQNMKVERSEKINQVIDQVGQLLSMIQDEEVRQELYKACNIAKSLSFDLATNTTRKYLEDKFETLLNNMYIQVQRWILHESGEMLLGNETDKVRAMLMYYDSLFLMYKHGDVESPEFLASLSSTEAEMLIQMLRLMMSGKSMSDLG